MGPTARAALTTIGVAALSACHEGLHKGAVQADGLVGAWRSEIRASSGALTPMNDLAFLTVFNAGGTMTESSNYDGAPPVPPAYGVWRRTADNRFEARYVFWVTKSPAAFDELAKGGGWGPNGYGVLVETISLASDGGSYRSTLVYSFHDPSGKTVPGGGVASGYGRRMTF